MNQMELVAGCSKAGKKRRWYTGQRHLSSGGGGIRTPGTLRYSGFQDRHLKPLGHSSEPLPARDLWNQSSGISADGNSDCTPIYV